MKIDKVLLLTSAEIRGDTAQLEYANTIFSVLKNSGIIQISYYGPIEVHGGFPVEGSKLTLQSCQEFLKARGYCPPRYEVGGQPFKLGGTVGFLVWLTDISPTQSRQHDSDQQNTGDASDAVIDNWRYPLTKNPAGFTAKMKTQGCAVAEMPLTELAAFVKQVDYYKSDEFRDYFLNGSCLRCPACYRSVGTTDLRVIFQNLLVAEGPLTCSNCGHRSAMWFFPHPIVRQGRRYAEKTLHPDLRIYLQRLCKLAHTKGCFLHETSKPETRAIGNEIFEKHGFHAMQNVCQAVTVSLPFGFGSCLELAWRGIGPWM